MADISVSKGPTISLFHIGNFPTVIIDWEVKNLQAHLNPLLYSKTNCDGAEHLQQGAILVIGILLESSMISKFLSHEQTYRERPRKTNTGILDGLTESMIWSSSSLSMIRMTSAFSRNSLLLTLRLNTWLGFILRPPFHLKKKNTY